MAGRSLSESPHHVCHYLLSSSLSAVTLNKTAVGGGVSQPGTPIGGQEGSMKGSHAELHYADPSSVSF